MSKGFSCATCAILIAIIVTLSACSANSSIEETETSSEVESTSSLASPLNATATPKLASPKNSPRILTPDWGIAATLTAMGYPPVATGDMRVYHQWVDDPKLPDSVVDLGIRYQPNAELIAQMDVDLVLDNFFYEHIRPLYGDTPALSVTFMSDSPKAEWQDYAEPTRQLGKLVGDPQAAEQYLGHARAQLDNAGAVLASRYPALHKVAIVQFADVNNLRMYSYNSLFQVALEQMGLKLQALEPGNGWGFVSIHLGDLAKLDTDTCLIIIEPISPMLKAELADNLVWQRMGFGTSQCMTTVPPIWIYGGSSSMVTFANRLQNAEFNGLDTATTSVPVPSGQEATL